MVTDDAAYAAFGRVIASSGSTENDFDWSAEPQLRRDPDTGYIHARRRDYDALITRFLNPDPKAFDSGDPNFYRYAGNNPVTHSDPSGMESDDARPEAPPEPGPRVASGQTSFDRYMVSNTTLPRSYGVNLLIVDLPIDEAGPFVALANMAADYQAAVNAASFEITRLRTRSQMPKPRGLFERGLLATGLATERDLPRPDRQGLTVSEKADLAELISFRAAAQQRYAETERLFKELGYNQHSITATPGHYRGIEPEKLTGYGLHTAIRAVELSDVLDTLDDSIKPQYLELEVASFYIKYPAIIGRVLTKLLSSIGKGAAIAGRKVWSLTSSLFGLAINSGKVAYAAASTAVRGTLRWILARYRIGAKALSAFWKRLVERLKPKVDAPNRTPWDAIDHFRSHKQGMVELGDAIPVRGDKLGTVAFVEMEGRNVFGVNSTALVNDADKALGRMWRDRLGFSTGQAQALFHAEAHSLMRAYDRFGGKLPRDLTLYVDRLTCGPCQGALPDLMKAMGIEHLKIVTKGGRVGEISEGMFKWLE